MRKVIYFLAAVALVATSCNKDEDIEGGEDGVLKVLEYRPAPGQFINENVTLNTQAEADAWAEKRLADKQYVSLGSFGGYLSVKMPKVIKNRKGYDFGINGNAFDGSSEPGIVWVMDDTNANGLADDTWYELKGSDTPDRGYEVTYTRPAVPGDISWTDNRGNSGVINYIPSHHTQNYYPEWIPQDTYTLSGSMLEHRTVLEGGTWKNRSFGWGYADNLGEDAEKLSNGNYRYNQFDLDNAIDASGNPVALMQIRFVKVQSAILHNADILGELSTEVVGFKVF